MVGSSWECSGHRGRGDSGPPRPQHPGVPVGPVLAAQVSRCVCTWQGRSRGSQRRVQGALSAAFHTDSGAPSLLPYQFRMEEIEGFRYRCRVSSRAGAGAGAGSGLGRPQHPDLGVPRMPCAR